MNNNEREEMFAFLEDLRTSGETNMFGAAPYLQEFFKLDKKQATMVLVDWMQNRE